MIQKKTGKDIFPFAKKPLLFGHRGCSKSAPENTIPAFRKILENGVPGVELDVHQCKSGELVISHDFNLKRITGIDTVIETSTFKELRELDFGSFYSEKYRGEQIPTLDDVFQLMGDQVYYDIEIKHRNIKETAIETLIMQKITEYNLENRVIISSFNPFAVRSFKKMFPSIPTAVIYRKSPTVPFFFRRGEGKYIAKPDILKPEKNQITERILKKRKYGIITWVVDDDKEAEKLLSMGIDGIISNQPEKLLSIIKKFSEKKGNHRFQL